MVVVGPSVIRRGLSPDTAIIGSGDMAYLGPARGDPGLDPISRIFLLVGKILSVRRLLKHEAAGQGENLIARYKQAQVALVDQAVQGHDTSEFDQIEVLWQPMANSVVHLERELDRTVAESDRQCREIFDKETVLILGVSPHLNLQQKVQAVIDYMNDHNLTVQDSDYGLRDYLMSILQDADGIPASFPADSDYPDFPDEWITPVPLDPAGVTRPWTILW